VPFLAWGIGSIGKKLKSKSLYAQSKWADGVSQIEETLGGLRIIKAFIAEKKMEDRFVAVNNEYRNAAMRVAIRQSAAHPVSEFLGTCMIVIVLWFGGYLIFSGDSSIDASAFIYYLVILYTILQPIKDLSRAGYSIQKGMASMERINKIMDAENNIREPEKPVESDELKDKIELKNVCFSYNDSKEILHDVNITIEKGATISCVEYIGGLIGQATHTSPVVEDNIFNSGNIVVNNEGNTANNVYVGGVVGNTAVMISNADSYCSLESDVYTANIGWVTGSARVNGSVVAASCKIGGKTMGIDEKDETVKEIVIDGYNFKDYIYGSRNSTDWTGTSNYDGCSFLSEKPTPKTTTTEQ
jgi:ATP-binding cassette subfamily B protein/subfamily B ATP-binding cassette protein MsbA